MLKWTNSAQKPAARDYESGVIDRIQTPHIKKRLRRRTTICQMNKENMVPITSTPFSTRLPHLEEQTTPSSTVNSKVTRRSIHRESLSHMHKYASTLPCFAEEYSPSTILPSGQVLAMRGLLPDVFLGNQRYFRSPLMDTVKPESPVLTPKLPKRKLEFELNKQTQQDSTQMTDQSLGNLIDAILESACKTQKKKKSRKSLNLRRRTLLKTQEENLNELSLSPSYAAGDDPASDLSFLLVEPTKAKKVKTTPTVSPPTPLPHTPAFNITVSKELLARMPTPVSGTPLLSAESAAQVSTTTFHLETPIRPTRKRRLRGDQREKDCDENSAKKYRANNCNYLEVGLALPSIYV